MVDLSSLKGKAQSRVQGLQDRLHSAPATTYAAPSTPSSSSPSAPSNQERFAQSTVLNYQKAINRPGPPPRRIVSSSSATNVTASSGSPPALPGRSVTAAPSLPPRNASTEVYDRDPVPPYEANQSTSASGWKRFTEYTSQDKRELFAMLDQYFEAKLSLAQEPSARSSALASANPPARSTPLTNASAPSPRQQASTRSYPRPTTYGSFAEDLLHSIMPLSGEPWYLSQSAMPPFLRGRQDMRWQGSFQMLGTSKTHFACVLFSDASIAWYRVDWSSTDEPQLSRNPSLASVQARYRPRPATADWTAEKLYAASETYGTLVRDFADQAVEAGRPVGRGECWDIANSALDHAAAHNPNDVPFPSLDRTHGVLLYYGKVGGEQTWEARDGYVRPGDIVEWRLVKIREKGMSRGSFVKLGDPEHTAVIMSSDVPADAFQEKQSTPLKALGNIEVVEQSQGFAPKRCFYDLSTMDEGEVWIYRPVSLRDLVGADFEVDWDYAVQHGYSLQ